MGFIDEKSLMSVGLPEAITTEQVKRLVKKLIAATKEHTSSHGTMPTWWDRETANLAKRFGLDKEET